LVTGELQQEFLCDMLYVIILLNFKPVTHLKVSCNLSHLRKKLSQENLLKLLAKVLHDTWHIASWTAKVAG